MIHGDGGDNTMTGDGHQATGICWEDNLSGVGAPLLELGDRTLGGETALQVPAWRVRGIYLNTDRLKTHLSDSSLASNSCLFSLISRWTLSSISRN
jgi:hypothetical protein